MIRTFTYRSRLDGKDPAKITEAIKAITDRRIRTDNTLRGVQIHITNDVIDLVIRVSGADRWRIIGSARKTASFILASQRLPYSRPLQPVLEVTEDSARNRTLAQGRTPQSRTGGRPSKRIDRIGGLRDWGLPQEG